MTLDGSGDVPTVARRVSLEPAVDPLTGRFSASSDDRASDHLGRGR